MAFTLKTYAHLFEAQRREAAMGIEDFLGTRALPKKVERPLVVPIVSVLN